MLRQEMEPFVSVTTSAAPVLIDGTRMTCEQVRRVARDAAGVDVDPAGVPLTEKQTNESSDVAGSPYAPPEPGPV